MDEKMNSEVESAEIPAENACHCTCEEKGECTCNTEAPCDCVCDCDCGCDAEDEGAETPVAAQTTKPPKRERPVIEITEDHLRSATEALAAIIGFLGLNGTVSAQKKDNKVVLAVNSPDAGRIIGRKGQNLEAIQFLLARILVKGEQVFPRITIDIDGYARNGGVYKEGHKPRAKSERKPRAKSERREGNGNGNANGGKKREFISREREATLRQQALDYAKEVVKWGEPITLPPMSAQERRIIHIALEESTDIKTDSIGSGPRKSVVISQK